MPPPPYIVPEPCRLPLISQLSPRVWRVMGLNPSPMTLGGTNCYIVGAGRRRILIDAGEGVPQFPAVLAEAMTKINEAFAATSASSQSSGAGGGDVTISDVLLTHWHNDHTGGIEQVRAMFPESRVRKAVSAVAPPIAGLAAPSAQHAHAPPPLVDAERIRDPDGTVTLMALATPGHTDDHFCFWLDDESAAFTGDCVLGYGSSVFASFPPFMRSLAALRQLAPSRIYPAHGPAVLDGGVAYLDTYIAHRKVREEQVAAAVASLCSASADARSAALHRPEQQMLAHPQSSPPVAAATTTTDLHSIVTAVYGDGLDPKLYVGASGNALHCLKKLVLDGRVRAVLPPGADPGLLDPSNDYHNDVYLARVVANAACSCAPAAQTALLDQVAKFRWAPA